VLALAKRQVGDYINKSQIYAEATVCTIKEDILMDPRKSAFSKGAKVFLERERITITDESYKTISQKYTTIFYKNIRKTSPYKQVKWYQS
jgi:hypothetical protein